MADLSIRNGIPVFSLNVLTVWLWESRALSLLEYNVGSSMNSRWFVVSPVRNSYPGLAILSMYVRGMRAIINNGDGASPWKIPLFIGTSPSVSAPQVSSTLQNFSVFPKQFTTFFACPSYLRSLLPRSEWPCHEFSGNWSIPSLGSSSLVLHPEEASYLCITFYFCILSALPVISLCFVENHGFHQQLSLTVSMSRGDM